MSGIKPSNKMAKKFSRMMICLNLIFYLSVLFSGCVSSESDKKRLVDQICKDYEDWKNKLNPIEGDTHFNHFRNKDLRGCNFSGKSLTRIDLSNTHLEKANFDDATLNDSIFSEAHLRGATLNRTVLSGAHLEAADLREADLTEAVISNEAHLEGADLTGACLTNANFMKSVLIGANLTKVNSQDLGLNLQGANLTEAILTDANLTNADLSRANLTRAKLTGVNLTGAHLNGTILLNADLSGATFNPEEAEDLNFMGAKGLSEIQFENTKLIVKMRGIAKNCLLRSEERALTAALRKHKLENWDSFFEKWFEGVLIDLPTNYGANPWRPLGSLGIFVVIFAFIYTQCLSRSGEDGIWKVWIPTRTRQDIGTKTPERLILYGWKRISFSLYFSLLSAFGIGWREIDVGNWIVRMQPREYVLRATGWMRTISGFQSLISLYLLTLWLFFYFGRPLE